MDHRGLGRSFLSPARSCPRRGPVVAAEACRNRSGRERQLAGNGGALPRWELTLDGQVGVPGGTLQVGETNAPGTSLRLHHDLGIDLSESVQGGAAFHFTPRDALRLTFVYFFLDGSATINHPIVYNGFTFPAGRIHTSADFYRMGVAYERALLTSGH